MQGDLDTALAQYTRALAIFERVGSAYGTGVICMNVGATQLLRSELDAASRSLERAGALFARAGAEDFLPELERYQAELLLAHGDGPAARAQAEAALATAQRLDARAEEGMTRRVLARALAEIGELAPAWQEIQVSQRILEGAESVYEVARTYLVTADLAARLGILSDGQQALAAALPILTGIGARRDLDEAAELAARWGYTIEAP
jgi:tetratricopeptide (TPR) repeat protein